jgi:peptide deformylase
MVISANIQAEILTLDKDIAGHLTTKCLEVKLDNSNRNEITKIISLLKNTLKPLLPAAGLAAPQIGITQRIFIFSWDRSEEHQLTAINPSFYYGL